jgi:hypothetical protein
MVQVERLPEPGADESRHASLEFMVKRHSVHVVVNTHRVVGGVQEGDMDIDGQPSDSTVVYKCHCTEKVIGRTPDDPSSIDFSDSDFHTQHLFWPAVDQRIGVHYDSTQDKGKVVGAISEVKFMAQLPDGVAAEAGDAIQRKKVQAAVSSLERASQRETASWITHSIRKLVDTRLPVMMRAEMMIEHGRGRKFVLRSQHHSAWDMKLRLMTKDGTLQLSGPVEGMPSGVVFTCMVQFEWRQALADETEAQTARMEERRAQEQAVQGRKLRLSGYFKIGDDPERLASAIQAKGEEVEELTLGLWSKKAVETVEIARTGKQQDGGDREIGAYVVMSSKVEADLLLQIIQSHKALSWGGKVVSAFICRQWKSKQARASVVEATRRGGRKDPQQGQRSTSSVARGKVVAQQQRQQQQQQPPARPGAPLPVLDPSNFPDLPKAVRWGENVRTGTQRTPQPLAAATAERTTHAVQGPAPGGEREDSDAKKRLIALAATVEAMRVRGEADRQLMKEQSTHMESIVEKLVMEMEQQRKATLQWQQQMQKMMDAQAAQMAFYSEEVRSMRLGASSAAALAVYEKAEGSCSPRPKLKKRRHKGGTATDSSKGQLQEDNGGYAAVAEEEDMDEHDGEEVGDSMGSLGTVALAFDAQANSSTAHPQPIGLVEGVGH